MMWNNNEKTLYKEFKPRTLNIWFFIIPVVIVFFFLIQLIGSLISENASVIVFHSIWIGLILIFSIQNYFSEREKPYYAAIEKFKDGQKNDAIDDLNKLINRRMFNRKERIKVSYFLFYTGSYYEVRNNLEKVNIKDSEWELKYLLACSLKNEGRYDEALHLLFAVLDKKIFMDLLLEIANCCFKLNRIDDSINYLKLVHYIDNSYYFIFFYIGKIYEENSDNINANHYFSLFLEINDGFESDMANYAKQYIESLNGSFKEFVQEDDV